MRITKYNKQNEKKEPNTPSNVQKWKKYSITIFDDEIKNARINRVNSNNNKRHSDETNKIKYGNNMLKSNFSNAEENMMNSENINKKKSDSIKMPKSYFININHYNTINIPKKMKSNKKMSSYKIKKQVDLFNSYNNIKENKYIEKLNKSGFNLTFNYIDSLLNDSNFNPKSILEKEFNIFDLEKK